jgi:hypothetical protein
MPSDQGGGPHYSGTRLDVATANVGNLNVTGAIQGSGMPVVNGPLPSGDVTGVQDTAAIQPLLDAARVAGGGVVQLWPGTYWTFLAAHPNFAGNFAGLTVGAGVILRGSGRNATTIKLAASQTQGKDVSGNVAPIMNYALLDENGGFEDFTLDGNAANQTHVHDGLYLLATRGFEKTRVRVQYCRGTAQSGNAENFHFQDAGSVDNRNVDCEAVGGVGSTASGFSAQGATGIKYIGCTGRNMTVNNGFTANNCRNLLYANCSAYLNAGKGFNVEVSFNVSYVGCHGGGQTPTTITGGAFIAQNTSLGNTQAGFFLLGPSTGILYAQCVSDHNGGAGMTITGLTSVNSAKVVGGVYSNNGTYGFSLAAAADSNGTRITGGPLVLTNTSGAIHTAAGDVATFPGTVTAPAVGSTGVAVNNPYPFDAMVYVLPGAATNTISVNATSTGVVLASGGIAQGFRVQAGGSITWTSAAAPTWIWFID